MKGLNENSRDYSALKDMQMDNGWMDGWMEEHVTDNTATVKLTKLTY